MPVHVMQRRGRMFRAGTLLRDPASLEHLGWGFRAHVMEVEVRGQACSGGAAVHALNPKPVVLCMS